MKVVRVAASRVPAEDVLRAWSEGRAATPTAFNDVVGQVSRLRDQVLIADPLWSPTVIASGSSGLSVPLWGWTHGSFPPGIAQDARLRAAREAAADALGYALRALRTQHRLLRTGTERAGQEDGYPRSAAIVGEGAAALLSTSLPGDVLVDFQPGMARSVLDAMRYGQDVLDARARGLDGVQSSVLSSASWMSREYASSSARGEWLAYAALGAATIAGLYLFGAFKSNAPEEEELEDDLEKEPPAKGKPARAKAGSKTEGAHHGIPLPKNPYGDPKSIAGWGPNVF